MTSTVRHLGSANPATPFPALERRSIAVNTANRQLAVGDEATGAVGNPLPFLAVRVFDARAQYAAGDLAANGGVIYRANAAIPPGSFNATNWTVVANDVSLYLAKAGGTMTGDLTLANSAPPSALVAASKGYVDTQDAAITAAANAGIATKVNKAGDVMSGLLTLSADPVANLDAATKQYADTKLPKAGGTMTGAIILPGTEPSAAQAAATKAYVDSNTAGTVHYDSVQALTAAQQLQARQNIYAAPFDALAYNGLQVNALFDVSQQYGGNAIASPPNSAQYGPDQWLITGNHATAIFTVQATPSGQWGFGNSFRISSTGGNIGASANDLARIYQPIEGYRIARLGWGTPQASPITIALYIYASVPGKLAVTINNFDGSRSYLTTVQLTGGGYDYKTITIPGCTDGTWKTDNSIGIQLGIASLSGTTYQSSSVNVWGTGYRLCTPDTTNFFAVNGNIISIAAFAMWPGNDAPTYARLPLILRPFDQELTVCKRYFQTINPEFRIPTTGVGQIYEPFIAYNTMMRAAATIALLSSSGASSSGNFSTLSFQDFGWVGYRITAIPNTAGEMYYNGFVYSANARMI